MSKEVYKKSAEVHLPSAEVMKAVQEHDTKVAQSFTAEKVNKAEAKKYYMDYIVMMTDVGIRQA